MLTNESRQNMSLALEAFDSLFNQRDYSAIERFWSPDYLQHSAHIPPGRNGLLTLVKSLPPTLRYENQLLLGDDVHVMLHGRFSGHGLPAAWIVLDVLRIHEGQFVEHWDVIQDEVTKAQSKSGLPMFGSTFPA